MSSNDPLANILSKMNNAERNAMKECLISFHSKFIRNVLSLMKDHGYIGEIEEVENTRGDFYKINLLGKINNCNVIKPQFSVKTDEFEKYEKRFLPAKDFGIIIVTTPAGLMTHEDAKKKNVGGRLIAYCY